MALDDVLDDTPPEAPEAVVEPTPEPTPVVEPEPVVEAPEPPKEPEATKVAEEEVGATDKERAFLSKANDEKRKRQGLERERDELKKQSEAREQHWQEQQKQWQQPPVTPEPPKEFWEDPEGALKTFRDDMQNMQLTTKLNTVEMIARSKYPDFDEKMAVFAEVMKSTPGVHQECMSSPDPAEYAYNLGKNSLMLRNAKDMPTLLEEARAQGRMDAEADFKAQAEKRQTKLDDLPGSLTDTRSTGNTRTVWSGPPSMDDILG